MLALDVLGIAVLVAAYNFTASAPFANATIASSTRTIFSPTCFSTSARSTTATQSSSPPAVPSQTPPRCPSSNNTIYSAPSGQQFVIECGIDHAGSDLVWNYVNGGLASCIALCDSTEKCVDVSLSGSACYMKSLVGQAISYPGLQGARLITPNGTTPPAVVPGSCPNDNGTEYITTASNKTFGIECGIDHAGGDLASFDVGSRDGSLWLQTCIELCGNTTSCVNISLSGLACYLKSILGKREPRPGISGARLISSLPTFPPATMESYDTESPTCPACNNTILSFEDSEASQRFIVECGFDHAGGDMTGEDNLHVGLRGPRAFRNCIEDCAETEGCVDVSFQGEQCFLKSSLGDIVYSSVVWGARMLS